tara:strand:- start:241 stop:495 length:255 start_codon:yes stop_codon:yes gene_type:complete
MALDYKINIYETDPEDASKTYVTFVVTNEQNQSLVCSTSITTGTKKAETILKEAQAALQTDIDAWAASIGNIGKTWNPDTEAIE